MKAIEPTRFRLKYFKPPFPGLHDRCSSHKVIGRRESTWRIWDGLKKKGTTTNSGVYCDLVALDRSPYIFYHWHIFDLVVTAFSRFDCSHKLAQQKPHSVSTGLSRLFNLEKWVWWHREWIIRRKLLNLLSSRREGIHLRPVASSVDKARNYNYNVHLVYCLCITKIQSRDDFVVKRSHTVLLDPVDMNETVMSSLSIGELLDCKMCATHTAYGSDTPDFFPIPPPPRPRRYGTCCFFFATEILTTARVIKKLGAKKTIWWSCCDLGLAKSFESPLKGHKKCVCGKVIYHFTILS